MELFTLGIDLGKTTFHAVGMNRRGEVVLRKRSSRVQLLHFTANLKANLIGMESSGDRIFWCEHCGRGDPSKSQQVGAIIKLQSASPSGINVHKIGRAKPVTPGKF
jgi:hypothetical protein